jgi:excisionase family DNA binding protein
MDLTVRQAAKKLSIRTTTVYPLIWDGFIKARKEASGTWRVDRASVVAYLKRRNQKRRAETNIALTRVCVKSRY